MINFTFIAFMFLTGTWNGRSSNKNVHKEPDSYSTQPHNFSDSERIHWVDPKRNQGIWNPRGYLFWVSAVFDIEFRDREIQTWHVLIFKSLFFNLSYPIVISFFQFSYGSLWKKYQGGTLNKNWKTNHS